MSLSVYMALEAKNEKGRWEKVSFEVPQYNGEMDYNDFDFPNGCHDIFTMLGYEYSGDYDAVFGIKSGLPRDASEKVEIDYKDWSDAFRPNVKVINLADLHIELLNHPQVIDYEYYNETSPVYKDNPLQEVYDKAVAWMSVWTSALFVGYCESDVRIIGWVM